MKNVIIDMRAYFIRDSLLINEIDIFGFEQLFLSDKAVVFSEQYLKGDKYNCGPYRSYLHSFAKM